MRRLPAGCPFTPRCPLAQAACGTQRPALAPVAGRLTLDWVRPNFSNSKT